MARIRTHEVDDWKRVAAEAGVKIDLVIHPEQDLAKKIMRVIRLPGVSDIYEFADGQIRLFGMNVEPDSWLAGLNERFEGIPTGKFAFFIGVMCLKGSSIGALSALPRKGLARDGVHPGSTRNCVN